MGLLKELVDKNRSYRRFDETFPIGRETMVELVELALNVASAANKQPLKYKIVSEPVGCAGLFPSLGWAGYLRDWHGPAVGERPTGYIALLIDESIVKEYWCDDGIAAQTIMLGAVDRGFGGCMIGNFKKNEVQQELGLADHLKPRLILALGKPAEKVYLAPMNEPDGDVRYWRDQEGGHHVPKRRLEHVLLD